MKLALTALGLCLAAPAAMAQDIQPVLDLPELARGQVISSTAKAQSRRGEARSASNAERICAQRASMRARYGRDDPRVQRLYRLCAEAGY